MVIYENQKDEKSLAILYRRIGNFFFNHTYYEKSLEYYLKSSRLCEEINYQEGLANCLNNMGNLFTAKNDILFNENDYLSSIKYLKEALNIWTQAKDSLSIANSLLNLGCAYLVGKEYDNANKYFSDAIKMYSIISDGKRINGLNLSYTNLGDLYLKLGVIKKNKNYFREAENYYNKCLKMLNGAGINALSQYDYRAGCLLGLGKISGFLGNEESAINYFQEGVAVAEKITNKNQLQLLYKELAATYASMNQFDKAYLYQNLYINVKDTLLNAENNKMISNLHVLYETERDEKEIALQKILVKKRNIQLLALLIVCLLVTVIGMLILWQYKLRYTKRTIEIQQKLLRLQMNPHFLFNSLFSIQSFMFENNSTEAAVYLSKFAELMRQILDSSREEYIPLQMEIKILENYLGLQKLRFENRFEYTIEVDPKIDIEFTSVPPMLTQPFIENAIEHGLSKKSEGGQITVRFFGQESYIQYEIEDNGIGIIESEKNKPSELKAHKSLAINIIRERLQILNRRMKKKILFEIVDLSVHTNGLQTGTKVIIRIPHQKFY